jgi:hypothetical protein
MTGQVRSRSLLRQGPAAAPPGDQEGTQMRTEPAGRPRRFHEVGFYRSDAECGALIIPFAEDGVAAGQPVILGYDDRKASQPAAVLAG